MKVTESAPPAAALPDAAADGAVDGAVEAALGAVVAPVLLQAAAIRPQTANRAASRPDRCEINSDPPLLMD
jgi:hypothetical protein